MRALTAALTSNFAPDTEGSMAICVSKTVMVIGTDVYVFRVASVMALIASSFVFPPTLTPAIIVPSANVPFLLLLIRKAQPMKIAATTISAIVAMRIADVFCMVLLFFFLYLPFEDIER
jgi:hypothetical protein